MCQASLSKIQPTLLKQSAASLVTAMPFALMFWLAVENWQKTYFICSEEKNMLISKHIADPHANGMAVFFLIFFTWGGGEKKPVFDHHMV